jgi:hypothetical protein
LYLKPCTIFCSKPIDYSPFSPTLSSEQRLLLLASTATHNSKPTVAAAPPIPHAKLTLVGHRFGYSPCPNLTETMVSKQVVATCKGKESKGKENYTALHQTNYLVLKRQITKRRGSKR